MKRTDDPRADYLVIATNQFADHGFHGVSLAALAQEAGVTKQALLHFFGTKERLYGDVLAALAARLCAEIDASAHPDPVEHLRRYFGQMAVAAMTDPRDARLVVRALLDADGTARRWPMKPYLDRLIAMTRAVPGRAQITEHDALVWAYQIIAVVQYLAISSPTVAAMYGAGSHAALTRQVSSFVTETVARLETPPS